MTQLELFRGAHVPLVRCLAALEAGDLHAAREALQEVQSPDVGRLALLEARLARERSR